jgi:hypothetical protein
MKRGLNLSVKSRIRFYRLKEDCLISPSEEENSDYTKIQNYILKEDQTRKTNFTSKLTGGNFISPRLLTDINCDELMIDTDFEDSTDTQLMCAVEYLNEPTDAQLQAYEEKKSQRFKEMIIVMEPSSIGSDSEPDNI